MANSVIIAIVQETACHLDLPCSIDKATRIIKDAAAKGAEIIVFGEAWLTGYPAWLDQCIDYTLWDDSRTKALFARMHANSVQIDGPEIDTICKLCKDLRVVLCMGFNEISNTDAHGTIFNSFVLISTSGEIRIHHRKLMPTFTEKLVYGLGDGRGLNSTESEYGKIGALICWEHWMPLVRQAMHQSGEVIHIALWPQVHEMLQVASRHYAFEGRCFVIAAGQLLKVKDLPDELQLKPSLHSSPDTLVLNGGSSIIGPDGTYLLPPQYETPELIICEIPDLSVAVGERMTLDVSGHYNRPDLFNFQVINKEKG
jgi:predicted amidohydrolase